MKKSVPLSENLVYYFYNLCSFGWLWALKIAIKKAIIEAELAK